MADLLSLQVTRRLLDQKNLHLRRIGTKCSLLVNTISFRFQIIPIILIAAASCAPYCSSNLHRYLQNGVEYVRDGT
jgi:hypothetical protein